MHSLSVSELNEQIKSLLESSFVRVNVSGELSRITFHNSGHIYFSIKDKNSTLKCVMFRSNAAKLRFQLQEGQSVFLDATLSVYVPRGDYQLNVYMIEPSGVGALALAYEQLKTMLQQRGYFENSIKKRLPQYPNDIALITSATSAALQDMLRVASERYPLSRLHVKDVLVQGERAAFQIAEMIGICDRENRYDVIVVARGGGSMEDLWCFNEQIVAEAIYHASTPIVSAVGHEIDWLISDYCADLRAPTPSAAMEMILPDKYELLQNIDALSDRYLQVMRQKLYEKREKLNFLRQSFAQHSIEQKLRLKIDSIEQLKKEFNQALERIIERKQSLVRPLQSALHVNMTSTLETNAVQITNLLVRFKENHPSLRIKKGYAQISKKTKVVELSSLHVDDEIDLMDSSLHVKTKVIEISKI